MEDKEKLEEELLAQAAGGTIDESVSLSVSLLLHGKGAFVKVNPGRSDIVDIEGMQEYFAAKGWKFIPGYGDEMNIFVGPDGMKYGNDYMIYLIEQGQI